MNISKVIFIGFMLIAGCVDINSSMQADMPTGVIKLSADEDGGGKSCALTISNTAPDPQRFNMASTSCKNDEARYFALENMPSTTRIRFDNKQCNEAGHDWYFLIKTIVHPTTTRRINLRELKDSAEGSIIVRGVMLVEKNLASEYQDGKLSCVVVWRAYGAD
ncbi:hypothetical protein [Pseudomonas sp. St316]|uniref:hypothetical protein n=1 Tax=Pseudomonas sp. St316 TaxID=2678257 RepID=UPI001BB3F0EB|nr:hypothetical protein [Pseudomonas sp. St316]